MKLLESRSGEVVVLQVLGLERGLSHHQEYVFRVALLPIAELQFCQARRIDERFDQTLQVHETTFILEMLHEGGGSNDLFLLLQVGDVFQERTFLADVCYRCKDYCCSQLPYLVIAVGAVIQRDELLTILYQLSEPCNVPKLLSDVFSVGRQAVHQPFLLEVQSKPALHQQFTQLADLAPIQKHNSLCLCHLSFLAQHDSDVTRTVEPSDPMYRRSEVTNESFVDWLFGEDVDRGSRLQRQLA
jgi:hypothetical protein